MSVKDIGAFCGVEDVHVFAVSAHLAGGEEENVRGMIFQDSAALAEAVRHHAGGDEFRARHGSGICERAQQAFHAFPVFSVMHVAHEGGDFFPAETAEGFDDGIVEILSGVSFLLRMFGEDVVLSQHHVREAGGGGKDGKEFFIHSAVKKNAVQNGIVFQERLQRSAVEKIESGDDAVTAGKRSFVKDGNHLSLSHGILSVEEISDRIAPVRLQIRIDEISPFRLGIQITFAGQHVQGVEDGAAVLTVPGGQCPDGVQLRARPVEPGTDFADHVIHHMKIPGRTFRFQGRTGDHGRKSFFLFFLGNKSIVIFIMSELNIYHVRYFVNVFLCFFFGKNSVFPDRGKEGEGEGELPVSSVFSGRWQRSCCFSPSRRIGRQNFSRKSRGK